MEVHVNKRPWLDHFLEQECLSGAVFLPVIIIKLPSKRCGCEITKF